MPVMCLHVRIVLTIICTVQTVTNTRITKSTSTLSSHEKALKLKKLNRFI